MEKFYADIPNALIISTTFLLIFAVAEIWRKAANPEVELTRKFVHFSSGAVCLSFAWLFNSHWTVLLLCVLFIGIMVVTKKANLLNAVHGVARRSGGGYYFPLSIYLTFLVASLSNHPEFYFIAILTLAVSDSLAAVIGSSYGRKFYAVEEDQKTLEGTIVFFMITFIIVHLSLLFLSDIGRLETVLVAVYVAFLVTAFESISLGGSDNFYIPIGTIAILNKFTVKGEPEMIKQLAVMFAIFVLVWLLLKKKDVKISGITGLALIGYGAFALVDFSWGYIILLAIAVYSFSNMPGKYIATRHGIRNVFYLSITAFIWVLIANFSGFEHSHFFLPFAASVISAITILINYQLVVNGEKFPLAFLKPVPPRFRSLLIGFAFLAPYLLFHQPAMIWMFFMAGMITPLAIVQLYSRMVATRKTTKQKMRTLALVTLFLTGLMFVLEDYFISGESVLVTLLN